MTPRSPFPSVIDSSLIASARSCRRKVGLEYFDHWKPKTQSVHLHAGAAYAKGLEVARLAYYGGEYHSPLVSVTSQGETTVDWVAEKRERGDAPSAIAAGARALIAAYGLFECPPESAKSLERVLGAYEYYFSAYPLTEDRAVPLTLPSGRLGVEFSFAEPIDFAHPETGDPLIYVGRMDMVVSYNGAAFGEDDKTTSQLGASWSRQWDLRPQFTGYCWGAKRGGLPLTGFLVRGVSILKTKYETQQAITYRPQWMIDEWYEQLVTEDLPALVRAWESGNWGSPHGHACDEYGGCAFKQVCLAQPADRISWLSTSFERRRWDPVTREETVLV